MPSRNVTVEMKHTVSEANFRREMISKKDFNQTKANSKSAQGERIFVTDKNERKQNHNKMENNQNNMRNDR